MAEHVLDSADHPFMLATERSDVEPKFSTTAFGRSGQIHRLVETP
jgi:hypothetical protein